MVNNMTMLHAVTSSQAQSAIKHSGPLKHEPLWGTWYIESLLGQGSFGKVYKAYREEFGKTYHSAIKIISIPQDEFDLQELRSEHLSDDSVRELLYSNVTYIISEIDLMRDLRGNSNIVSFDDHMIVEKTDGIGWDILIRMELLTSLAEHIAQNPLSKEETVRLGIHMCRALELCAMRNVIHRDIKPGNIFISSYNEYKLGDFGIARHIERTMSATSRIGTQMYMAPEVFKGENYGASVDIYSLGIVLYRLLNKNRLPFTPEYPFPITAKVRDNALKMRMSGEPIPPLQHGVSPELNALVLKACAYNPNERFTDPAEMRKALEAAAETKGFLPKAAPISCHTLGEAGREGLPKTDNPSQYETLSQCETLSQHETLSQLEDLLHNAPADVWVADNDLSIQNTLQIDTAQGVHPNTIPADVIPSHIMPAQCAKQDDIDEHVISYNFVSDQNNIPENNVPANNIPANIPQEKQRRSKKRLSLAVGFVLFTLASLLAIIFVFPILDTSHDTTQQTPGYGLSENSQYNSNGQDDESKNVQHIVTYNTTENGGALSDIPAAATTSGAEVDLTHTATKAGWQFVGWNTNKDAAAELPSYTMPASDVTLYAIYKKTLTATFKDQTDSTDPVTYTVPITIYNNATGGQITVPSQNTHADWTSRGWSTGTAPDAGVTVSSGSYTISADTTFYALHQRTLTLSYSANNTKATVPAAQSVTQYSNSYDISKSTHAALTAAEPITLAGENGRQFSHWSLDLADNMPNVVYRPGSPITIDTNSTLYAIWK
jgi:uncharacterized repeat protein (TIGR02543 family)